MIEDRTRMLTTTIYKLYRRGALRNIQKIIVKTHTADVASVLQSLEFAIGLSVLKLEPSLDKRAAILSYLNPELQKKIFLNLEKKEIRDIISRMESDDAADVLGRLPEELSAEILNLMKEEDSEGVVDLMGYPVDSAGGLMSTDVLAFDKEMTVADAIKSIQGQEHENTISFYVYVVNDAYQLVGVLSLKELLLSRPTDRLKEIMAVDFISVSVTTHQDAVAKTVERYDFLAIPVLDDSSKLVGVITVDDIIDVIRKEAKDDLLAMGRASPTDWSLRGHLRARLPWLSLAFVGGFICFLIIRWVVESNESSWIVWAFAPLVLSMSATSVQQSASVAVGFIRSDLFEAEKYHRHLFKELQIGSVLAAVFSLLTLAMGYIVLREHRAFSLPLVMALAIPLVASHGIGGLFPFVLHKMGIDPAVASIPLATFAADILAVGVLFGFMM